MDTKLCYRSTGAFLEERGQMTIIAVLVLPVVFMLFSFAFDAGVWALDHRLAQNQVDAAALAAIDFLPAEPATDAYFNAEKAVSTWLIKNGSDPAELCGPDDNGPYPQLLDMFPRDAPDGKADAIRVCIRRPSPGIFAGLADLDFVYVSAVAMARVGPVGAANVKPWAIAPDDPTCNQPGTMCYADMDADPTTGDEFGREKCGYYPEIPANASAEDAALGLCPWGLHEYKLHRFKVADNYEPGNFAPIEACGKGGGDTYGECIDGTTKSQFFQTGDTVRVDIETGNMVGQTTGGLERLYVRESQDGPCLLLWKGGKCEVTYQCDAFATPDPVTGLDQDGHRRAEAVWVQGQPVYYGWDPLTKSNQSFNFIPGCEYRLVSIVIIDQFPSGGGDALVLGVGTFGIARWDRIGSGAYLGNDDQDEICGQASTVKEGVNSDGLGGAGGFDCGQVWGYFMKDARPPEVLLTILETDQPFAPVMSALVE